MSAPAPAALCPSAPPEPGAALIGVAQPDGRMSHFATPVPVNDAFLAEAGAQAGKLYRFAAPCAEAGCGHWGEGGCTLIASVRARAAGLEGEAPRCGIRAACRWWQQDGVAACRVCSLVTYDPG